MAAQLVLGGMSSSRPWVRQRLNLDPVHQRLIVLEQGSNTGLVQLHCFVIAPFTRLSLGCSQSHFTSIYTDLLNCSFHLWQLKGLTMHGPLLRPVRNCYPQSTLRCLLRPAHIQNLSLFFTQAQSTEDALEATFSSSCGAAAGCPRKFPISGLTCSSRCPRTAASIPANVFTGSGLVSPYSRAARARAWAWIWAFFSASMTGMG
ncbi:hypothetical protein O77CONTIG1_00853 [Leptolyngbya sp. O-77]|nr:hypothetical protein O77CONTIG1_00853 [Leptolyngbya sp. O-77]